MTRGLAALLCLPSFGCTTADVALPAPLDASNDIASPDATLPDAAADAPSAPPLTPSGPLRLIGAADASFVGLHITSDAGPCVRIENGHHVTIQASEIGPCGGNGIEVAGGDSISVSDSYVHPEHPAMGCCDTGDGVFATGTTGLTLQGNVIAFGEANIEVNTSSGVHVIGNFLLNPQNAGSRGQNFQSWGSVSDVTIEGNYALSSVDPAYKLAEKQEDSINFGFTTMVVAKGNYVQGGHSPSGCGIIADEAADGVTFQDNVLVDTGQCGISIASGTNQVVARNRILNSTPVAGGGNTGLVVWKQYPDPCGPVTMSDNVSSELKPDMTESGYWNGGGCDPVTLSGNVFDSAARAMLSPAQTKLPPPLIPPQPVSCAAATPWTNQVGAPPCWSPPSLQ